MKCKIKYINIIYLIITAILWFGVQTIRIGNFYLCTLKSCVNYINKFGLNILFYYFIIPRKRLPQISKLYITVLLYPSTVVWHANTSVGCGDLVCLCGRFFS